jgi:hypothetical protein
MCVQCYESTSIDCNLQQVCMDSCVADRAQTETLLRAGQDDGVMNTVHEVMRNVQDAVYEYEGSINKFLMV